METANQFITGSEITTPGTHPRRGGRNLDVSLCRNEAMRTAAYRLRYRVYCEELGRRSPYADHEKKIIKDPLDDFGLTFLAVRDGKAIGTIRCNLSAEGPLGVLEELYDMRSSIHHPHYTAVISKFVVSRSCRGGPVALKLVAAIRRYGRRYDVRECYIDCTPQLVPFYRFFGFEIAGRQFNHYENGPSYPMIITLKQPGRRSRCAL